MTAVKYPFNIYNGRVVMAEDPSREIESAVMFCLSTQVGERVMQPEWGIDIMNSSYAMGAGIETSVDEAIRSAFRRWFPDYQIRKITVTPNTFNPTYVEVDVNWGKYGSSIDKLSKVGVQIPGGSEMFSGEGY